MKQILPTLCVVAALMVMCASAASTGVPPAAASVTSVYAAGSLRTALTSIAHAYEERTGQRVVLTFDSSGLLRQRIQRGGDAQVFASADMGQPERLARSGGWREPVVFARSKLCLLTRSGFDVTTGTVLAALLHPDTRIGTSTPGADPSGDYTWQFFRQADKVHPGAYATLDKKAIKLVGGHQRPQVPTGQNPVAWSLAHDKIDVFVSYCNSAHALQRQHLDLKVIDLPPALAVAATYGMTVRTDAPAAAQQFAAALLSPRARQVFDKNGFGAP